MAKVQFTGGGGTTSPSGVAGAIQFSNGSAFSSDATNLFWDDTNNRLNIGGTVSPTATLHVKGLNDSSGSSTIIQSATYEIINAYNSRNLIIGSGSISAGVDYKINAFGTGALNSDTTLQINGAGSDNIFTFYNSPGYTNGGLSITRNALSNGRNALTIVGGSAATLSITSAGSILFNSSGTTVFVDSDGNYIQPTTSATHGAGIQGMLYNTFGGGSAASHIFRKGRGLVATGTGAIVHLYGGYTENSVSNNTTPMLKIAPIYNLTGVGVRDMIGVHYAPTVTAMGPGRNYAFVAESGNVVIGAATANASAALEVTSTTQGFLPPRMTAAQAELISSPAAGLLIYATTGTGVTITSTGWWGYTGSTWNKLN